MDFEQTVFYLSRVILLSRTTVNGSQTPVKTLTIEEKPVCQLIVLVFKSIHAVGIETNYL